MEPEETPEQKSLRQFLVVLERENERLHEAMAHHVILETHFLLYPTSTADQAVIRKFLSEKVGEYNI